MSELTCDTCEYMKDLPHYGGYCYMFRDKGRIVDQLGHCAQHTSLPKPTPEQAHRNAMVACIAILFGGDDFDDLLESPLELINEP